ncbi:hypothetical protein LRP50_05070 [Enterovibrio sp. ZSDZ42]|uniref:Uncharacterized protein n=1 Tax=Enterovibrio gelatinilyticus TaxID=2899819 RepID=A0ABT5QWV0_9GAMM|nr:hypothetical protein [Enterovibrio sp. ZSDZ42]MDD1792498.1 hypothetical protein [Enterovibrio sp. ZSDZ42]
MCSSWNKQRSLLGVLLSLLLVCFSAGASTPFEQQTAAADFSIVVLSPATYHQQDSSDSQNDVHPEHRAPAKSIAPDLASTLRNGSFLPERLHNSEPNYELVFDFEPSSIPSRLQHVHVSSRHWHDWTLKGPPSSLHRISGWKESNLLYRFISQADTSS